MAPWVQKISGLTSEDPENIPPVCQYNPSYATVDSNIKGNVKYKLNLKNNRLTKRKKMIDGYTSELK